MSASLYYFLMVSSPDRKELSFMTFTPKNTLNMMVEIDPSCFRFPQPSDKFVVKLTDHFRQYVVVNKGHYHPTSYVVTFMVAAASGKKLASCTCTDFHYIRNHGRQCKHIHVAYNLHISRMKAAQAASK
jgi:hypothetical protein